MDLRRLSRKTARLAVWLLVLAPPLIVIPELREAFRLPKLMAVELLGLVSLVFLAATAPTAWSDWRRALVSPAVRFAAPLLVAATVSLAFTGYPARVSDGLVDLWIGLGCLVGWSLGFDRRFLERALHGLVWPAIVLAGIGIGQRFFDLEIVPLGLDAANRMAMTSLAGNPGDLAAFLVLPALLVQTKIAGSRGELRWLWGAILLLILWALAATATLTAFAAVALGSAVLWVAKLRRSRSWTVVAGVLAGVVALGAIAVMATPTLRSRAGTVRRAVESGDLDVLLSGRPDGWKAAFWMVRENPVFGVGHRAYGAEFGHAKLALADEGVSFFSGHRFSYFSNAHAEPLQVLAEWGLVGIVALLWGLVVFLRRCRGMGRGGDRAPDELRDLVWAAVVALLPLVVLGFPFRVALVAYPWLLFASLVFSEEGEEE